MKKRAKRIFPGGLNSLVAKCPFCDYEANVNNPINYCAGCGAVIHMDKRGLYIFDNKKLHPLFRAQQAGGLKIGNKGDS